MLCALVISLGLTAPAPADDGLSLVAALPKQEYLPGEPIPLGCTFTNNSREDFEYFPSYFYRNHHLVVRNDKGERPRLAKEGKLIEQRAAIEGGKNRYMSVKVGQTIESLGDGTPENDLARIYDLRPGKYTVAIKYKPIVGKKIELTSNTLHFEVK